ncbi:MAG: lactate racemase domain-containing protein [bacterium]
MTIGVGKSHEFITDDDIRGTVAQGLDDAQLDGKRVLAIIPDSTRTMPMPLMFRLLTDRLLGSAKAIDFLVALGTHPPMSEEALNRLVGLTAEERNGKYRDVGVMNHAWDDPDALRVVGTMSAAEIEALSGGLMSEDVPVAINRMIFDYDVLLIVGPVFPHEVVGFSGGNKYLFPGIAGPEIIHFFHWLGAVVTNPLINGTKDTVTRRVVERAAELVGMPALCFALVTRHAGNHAIFFGSPREAWSAAADVAKETHIRYVDRTYDKVLGLAPEMYDDIWTAGKVMYKLEPILADGADLIIDAPHIDEVSYTHGAILDRIGYHTRDYFLKQMEKFEGVPRGIMAHSTHVKGIGTYEDGVEKPRCNVILATGIPKERCGRINLGYRDPESIDVDEWTGREDEGVLVVPEAGETLYRLADGSVPRIEDLSS